MNIFTGEECSTYVEKSYFKRHIYTDEKQIPLEIHICYLADRKTNFESYFNLSAFDL